MRNQGLELATRQYHRGQRAVGRRELAWLEVFPEDPFLPRSARAWSVAELIRATAAITALGGGAE